ncbi:MAG TPA: protein jag [Epulopiscium sp.]|nr:protein jag [Candidatus Epulonipiscium sp.]
MKFVEKIAKTVDDAVTEALLELMVTRDNVEIEIIEKGSKGFLGIGAKDAKVKITVIEKEKSLFDELIIEKPNISLMQEINPKVDSGVDPIEVGKAFLKDVLEKMDIKAEIEASMTKENIKMVISGDKMGLLIGKRGENLDALQYLVNLVVNKNTEKYTRVILDTENYRQRREETLKKLAFRLAKKASQTKQRIVLEPMNPYDRRIIHSALQNSKTVKTYSEGKEPYRKIVIIPVGANEHNKE